MIDVQNLSKKYGNFQAVDGISFVAKPGEVVGFLGPNGAGKSTTMRMITGFIAPSSGAVKLNGFDTAEHPTEAKKHIGYLPESAPSYRDIKVREFLTLIAGIRGISKENIVRRVDEVIALTFLQDVENRIIDTLSKGYRQRVCFAQAIIHNPPILILDEPTDGLDPNQKNEIRHLIRQIAKEKTIILSTHILEEMEALCDRALIISKGKIVLDSSPAELLAMSAHHHAVRFSYPENTQLDVLGRLSSLDNIADVQLDSSNHTVTLLPVGGTDITTGVLQFFQTEGFVPEHFTILKGRMDEVFSSLTAAGDKITNENRAA